MNKRVILLVARPTPSGVDARSLAGLADAVRATVDVPVRIAHLDQADPSIHAALDAAVGDGTPQVEIVALAVPADPYLRSWIARAVANWRETRAPLTLDIRIADELSTAPALVAAVAALGTGTGEEVTASPGAFRSPSWSVIPEHNRHLFLCRGPRCTAYGAGATHRALGEAVRGTATIVSPIGCLGPCNLGPLVVEYPGGTWHRAVDAERAVAVVCGRVDEPAHH